MSQFAEGLHFSAFHLYKCLCPCYAGYVQLFQVFGRWGDGIEVLRAYTYNTGYNVLCGSNTPNAAYEWRFANGSRIGISNSGFRAAHFSNGENFVYCYKGSSCHCLIVACLILANRPGSRNGRDSRLGLVPAVSRSRQNNSPL